MKRLVVTCCLVVVVLVGCVTSYSGLMDSWVGSTETELVERWGEPDSVVTRSDGKVLTYELFWTNTDKVVSRGRMKFAVDQEGRVVSWQKTNFPDMLFGREHRHLIR